VKLLTGLFGVAKPVIAMVHLRALPGRPGHDKTAGIGPIAAAAAADIAALQTAGVDGLLFCNEADLPYQLGVGQEAAAAMAAIIGQLRPDIVLPFGVDLVWDPVASLAVARAAGACFVREVFTGGYESDLGVMRPDSGAIGGYRRHIGADRIAVFANITPEFASPLAPPAGGSGGSPPRASTAGGSGGSPPRASRGIAERARGAASLGVDALLISGPITGVPTDAVQLSEAKAAVPRVPVLANTGVTARTIAGVLARCDGAIVGTALKAGSITWNPVDQQRAAELMAAARQAREAEVTEHG
jgi:uncharacterized protein